MPSYAPPHRVRIPVSLQRWESISFLHWPFGEEELQRRLPRGLTVDTYEGRAWVGLTPFTMRIRPMDRIPIAGAAATFPETNLRTYVKGPDGEDGLWFFSLDVTRSAAVLALRTGLGLPYRWAQMRVEDNATEIVYRSRRIGTSRADHHIVVRPGAPVEQPDPLLRFLTGRWRAYTQHGGRLLSVPVEHEPWPLAEAEVRELSQHVVEAAGLPTPTGDPLTHFSKGVSVRFGRPVRVSGAADPLD